MPAIYISKYNRFVDNIIGRINRILGKSYDPVRVKLQSNESKNKGKGKGKGKSKGKKKNSGKKHPRRTSEAIRNKMGELEIARTSNEVVVDSGRSTGSEQETIKNVSVSMSENRARPVSVKQNKNKKKNTIRAGSTNNKNKKNKTKQTNNKNKQRARATLFGLSSIKRDGDVNVGQGARRELKSATATTAEMFGRLNLRIMHGGAATLHSIRVLQPKQVRVDSAEDHDKSREYMWKRSAHIAAVVSRKLASAARSMLQPPPSNSS
ncbi:hypothetical protein NQ314_020297 [Rhamnusium bicolor]|uniref:Uncharacterized protein n=1 Tax=Rhamnusium bicolor TaxID=1586634 RepID=A0AAV8WLV8_9CUCU|nr:hypothetical protein NQ314_020297 [Rhamnusium bicolor]